LPDFVKKKRGRDIGASEMKDRSSQRKKTKATPGGEAWVAQGKKSEFSTKAQIRMRLRERVKKMGRLAEEKTLGQQSEENKKRIAEGGKHVASPFEPSRSC